MDYVIEAALEYDLVQNDIAAAKVNHPYSSAVLNYTDDELADYNDFIDNVYNAIGSFGFDMLDEHQSGDSYAYYITFRPKDVNGDYMNEIVQVKFRIADHPVRGGHDNYNARRVFRSFVLGGRRHPDPISLIAGVERVCEAIRNRDFSGLMQA